jgi:actin-related protein 3
VVQAWGSSVQGWGSVDEAFWHETFFTHLRVDPEDHTVMLAEPAHSISESREAIAEVLFETFNAAALHLVPAPAAALYAAAVQPRNNCTAGVAGGTGVDLTSLTGLVVDSGEGVTQVRWEPF